ncbi:uncharacterized protein LOC120068947 [Benincasa hispida]|uniref:uncharacterized protein LOC120068947 n=1 Tax=Benincasa hispida TaxID=102211 RepID=UPI0019016850|nr:uncharacterized protein LOC120068947 [Benincasa hispida]
MEANHTWFVVPLPSNQHSIGYKWVYKEHELADWTKAEDLAKSGDIADVEVISSSTRGFVVSFGSLIGFMTWKQSTRGKLHDPKFYTNSSLLVDLIDALDRLCTVEGDIFGVPKENLESIIGATIGSYLKLLSSEKARLEELNRLVYLAKRYSSCSQVLVVVADYLDFIYGILVNGIPYVRQLVIMCFTWLKG